MSQRSRRIRSSTSASALPVSNASSDQLQRLVAELTSISESRGLSPYPDFVLLAQKAGELKQCLIETSSDTHTRDTFRHSHGFQSLLHVLRTASGSYNPTTRTLEEKRGIFALLRGVLGVLAEALRDHHGNLRYFRRRVDGGGWEALEQAIASIGIGGSETEEWGDAHLFTVLLAFALDLDASKISFDIFQVGETPSEKDPTPSHIADHVERSASPSSSDQISRSLTNETEAQDDTNLIKVHLAQAVSKDTRLSSPEILPTILSFWKVLPRQTASARKVALVVIHSLSRISSLSTANLLAMHDVGVLSALLPLALDDESPLTSTEKNVAEDLCHSLISLGLTCLDDARYLLRSRSEKATEFFLKEMKSDQSPARFQFDLSLHGYASIELSTLGRSFPPPSSVPGYTFTAWIYIDQYDSSAHTTIFGAFDSSQTCFVLAYIEKDTHNFILQTSVTSSRPSVRFKSTVFHPKKWYHIGIVHLRPRTITSSKAALYVNGEFAEQVKCQYPANPPSSAHSTESFTSFPSSSSKTNPVQAFIGTPRDLSTCLGRGRLSSIWSLASAHLFEEVLSDDMLAVHYRLGPRYNGNYQDALGSFQTYEASAALGLRTELKHPGKHENSEILAAIRAKASTVIPESRVLLSILPSAVLGHEERLNAPDSQLVRGLSRMASSTLLHITRGNGTAIAINAAIPVINDALTLAHGFAMLAGDPVVVIPQSLDDAMWRLAGCTSIGLKMVESATTREGVVRAVDILLESVKSSWRNSEAMERENGYAILGALIRGKVGAGMVITSEESTLLDGSIDEREKLSFELLSLVLGFVGYIHGKPETSMINNPLAYRILLVDFDMWRKTAPMTQKLYYKQFITFGVTSVHHSFNARRLFRMRK